MNVLLFKEDYAERFGRAIRGTLYFLKNLVLDSDAEEVATGFLGLEHDVVCLLERSDRSGWSVVVSG